MNDNCVEWAGDWETHWLKLLYSNDDSYILHMLALMFPHLWYWGLWSSRMLHSVAGLTDKNLLTVSQVQKLGGPRGINTEVNTNLLPSNCAIPSFLHLYIWTTNCSHLHGATVPEDTCIVLQLDSIENNSVTTFGCDISRLFCLYWKCATIVKPTLLLFLLLIYIGANDRRRWWQI
jgi:hypothetical protein